MFPAALCGVELLLSLDRVQRHLFTLRDREGLLLHLFEGQCVAALVKGGGDGAHQPILQHPHAPNTALVEIEPVLDDQLLGIGTQRHFLEQGQEDGLEGDAIFGALELIPGEMNRQTPSGCLPIQPGEAQQFIST
jgi:hypothetical protein